MASSVTSDDAASLRLLRWVGGRLAPLSLALNVGCYALALWLTEQTRPGSETHAEAWRTFTVVVLIAGQAGWLVWLRRQALSTLVASVLLWIAALLIGGYEVLAVQPGLLLAVFGFAAEITGVRRMASLVAMGVAVWAGLVGQYALYRTGDAPAWHSPGVLVLWALAAAATIGVPGCLGGWFGQLRDRSERIAELAHIALAGEANRIADAVAAERRTLAQEIHDTSSAHLAALLALSFAARTSADTGDAARYRPLIDQIRMEGEQLFDGFERMLTSMRHDDRTVTEHHQRGHRAGQHAIGDIPGLIDEHRLSTTGTATFTHDPTLREIDVRLGPMRAHVAFRVIQEALGNVRKHAPGAPVAVTMTDDGSTLLLRIENGRSPSSDSGAAEGSARAMISLGYGLEGMRDRLGAAGGSLRTGPRRNGGWSVNALLPHPPHHIEPPPSSRRAVRAAGPPARSTRPTEGAVS